MEGRIVPPAILCVIATNPIWALAGGIVAVGILSGGSGLFDIAVLAPQLLIPGFIIVGLSMYC